MPESLWKNRDFALLITGRTVSQFGTAMTTFVIPWLFLQLTGSGTQTGIAFAFGFIPYIILSFPAGVWADRFNRKTLMIIADSGRLALLLSIPLAHLITGATPLYLLYVIQAGVSGLSAIFDAAYGACLPNIVAPNQLREANNTLQTSMSLSKIVGPILGGVAISWIGAANTILIDVASYIVSIASMFAIVKSFSASKRHDNKTFFQDIRQGIGTVWNIKPIRYLMLFATLVNLVGPGMDVALLYRLQHELTLGSQWAGIIMTGLSGGMLLGSLVNRWIGKQIDMGPWLTISAVLQVFPPIILAFTRSPILICLVQVFIGILLVAWNVQSVTLRQTLIQNHLLGRSSSVFRLSAWISIPIGDALAGMIGQTYGTKTYFIMAAGVLLIVSVLCVCVKLHRTMPSSKPKALAS
jgi:MFS family permease